MIRNQVGISIILYALFNIRNILVAFVESQDLELHIISVVEDGKLLENGKNTSCKVKN